MTETELNNIIDDVEILGGDAYTTLTQLEALFEIIKEKADGHSDIKTLAGLGEYLAMDKANVFDCLRERLIKDIKKGEGK